jgi:hypothetical protein
VTEHDIPQERDLPAGRLTQLKDELMALIEDDPIPQRRWPRVGLAAAALVATAGFAGSLVLGGNDEASANTAVRTDDGIVITINEGKNPKELERRLNDLGVPAVVDFLESGFGCDPARSSGWVEDAAPGEALFAGSPDHDSQYVLHPDELEPGQTIVFEFYIDEHEDDMVSLVEMRLSTSPVGECVRVPDSSIVDAENGIVGG